ncbi:hypothetical protein GOV12_07665 [Candidatus Pacearchaeota archaeon]|nr:hypothetical protein [Candidatus Pacearchaeota archaeon]
MKTGKSLFIFVMSVLLITAYVVSVSSLDASIGNGKMILREDVGTTIDKSIRVINTNDFPVKIEMSISGELTDNIELIDETFIIPAGSKDNPTDKEARFKITFNKIGTQEGSVDVKFIAENTEKYGKTGVALPSTIILIGLGENDNPSDPDDPSDPSDPGNPDDPKNPGEAFKFNPAYYLLIVTVVIFLILVFVIMMYSKNNKNIDKTVDKTNKAGDKKDRGDVIKPKKRVIKG